MSNMAASALLFTPVKLFSAHQVDRLGRVRCLLHQRRKWPMDRIQKRLRACYFVQMKSAGQEVILRKSDGLILKITDSEAWWGWNIHKIDNLIYEGKWADWEQKIYGCGDGNDSHSAQRRQDGRLHHDLKVSKVLFSQYILMNKEVFLNRFHSMKTKVVKGLCDNTRAGQLTKFTKFQSSL